MDYKYLFRGGSEFFYVELKGNNISLRGSVTNDIFIPFSPELFRPNKEKMNAAKLLLSKWPTLSQEERNVYLCFEFGKMGYVLLKKERI